ncbi:MAG: RING finger protein [Armatimonadota bacterium]
MSSSDIFVGKTCPYCQTPIKPGAAVSVCSACEMPHHAECWQENGRCTTFGCAGRPTGAGAAAAAAPSVRRTRDGHTICPVCEYVMTPFDATCPRCENLRSQGRTPGPASPPPAAQPYAQPYAQPGYGTMPPPPAAYPQAYAPQQMPYQCPYELRRWNWGAFAIPLFWSAAMNQWLWFALCFVPCVNIVVHFYLGVKGNELAWQSRAWSSPQQFEATQDVWNKWGIPLFILWIILQGCNIMFGVFSGLEGGSSYGY